MTGFVPGKHWYHFGDDYYWLGPDRSGKGSKGKKLLPADRSARIHDIRYARSAHHPRGAKGVYRSGADFLAGVDMISTGSLTGLVAGTGLVLQSFARGATLGFIEFPWD